MSLLNVFRMSRLSRQVQQVSNQSQLEVIPDDSGCEIKYDQNHPPDVFFDTNVWRGMGNEDVRTLKQLQDKRGFSYRYSTINFLELVSHLDEQPSEKCKCPFSIYRSCFRKIIKLCHKNILPSPEMEFLEEIGLKNHINNVWIPDIAQMALQVEVIANAGKIEEITKVINIDHYRTVRFVDKTSMQNIMKKLNNFDYLTKDNSDQFIQWFLRLAFFFLIERPTGKKITYEGLTKNEQNRFHASFTQGSYKLFYSHCISISKKIINDRKKIDPNDLYDMLQLILLKDKNLLFVTSENSFFRYLLNDHKNHRIIYWNQFRKSC
ncbi:MAG: hypothetical protein ACUZ8O_06500 [Candidatus Anammoxibacter sp.]